MNLWCGFIFSTCDVILKSSLKDYLNLHLVHNNILPFICLLLVIPSQVNLSFTYNTMQLLVYSS